MNRFLYILPSQFLGRSGELWRSALCPRSSRQPDGASVDVGGVASGSAAGDKVRVLCTVSVFAPGQACGLMASYCTSCGGPRAAKGSCAIGWGLCMPIEHQLAVDLWQGARESPAQSGGREFSDPFSHLCFQLV